MRALTCWSCGTAAGLVMLSWSVAAPAETNLAEVYEETIEIYTEEPAAGHGTVGAEEQSPEDPRLAAMRQELERLQLEAQLRTARLEAELAEAKAQQQRLAQELERAQQQQHRELLPLSEEQARLEAAAGLDAAKRSAESAPLDAELALLQKQQQLAEAKLAAELTDLKAQTQKLRAEQALAAAQRQAELAEASHRQMLLTAQNESLAAELRAQQLELESRKTAAETALAVDQARLMQQNTKDQLGDVIDGPPEYRTEPFVDGVLYVSDRRIALNGPIITGTADYVCDRIHYFNNEDPDAPIFLMIDNCPGGSVMQGYRIVKAIEASDAPVHVVVKSFAASMAAIITTLADHSYAYPDAIMLHHQMSAGAFGNMTDIEETVEVLKEWEARLAEPVAEKMGVTAERFVELMYENKSDGDWEEFADRAVELKWVNTIVGEVREEGVRRRPTGEAPKPWWFRFLMQDEHGRSYVNLPPLEPMDAYMMYNPNGFYRVDGR
ncbi:MAG: ATP-dependent Clp protease proteolytic subunit [Planctomycetota bacterium]